MEFMSKIFYRLKENSFVTFKYACRATRWYFVVLGGHNLENSSRFGASVSVAH